jgi:hypothetical protein
MRILEMIAGSRGMGDARSMGEMLRRMGRRGDTMLAHITPEEADMLMQAGGSGTTNPMTGLPEFAPRRSSDFDNYTPRRTSQPAGATFEIPNVELDTNYTPRRVSGVDVPTDFGFEEPSYQAAGNQFDLLAGGRVPNVRTGGYEVPAQQRVYEGVDFANYLPRLSPDSASIAQFTDLPRTEGLRLPDQDIGLSTRALQQAPEPYFSGAYRQPLAEFQPLQDQTAGEPSLAQRAETGLRELQDVLNRYPNLTRAGTAGASILAQALMFNQANKAMRRDIESTRAAAEPFRQAQQEAMSRATGEGLTPEQQQEMEIAQARAREALGQRGTPTGSAAAGILAAQQRRARSLARQESFTEALRLANIADQYDRRALEMELARDQQLAQLFAGILGREVQQAQRYQAPVTQPTR